MKLSVLISVYNGEEYVKRCLKGVLNQNIPPSDYEIILIDDGSNDNTYQIAKEFAKEYNHIKVFTQKNLGLYNTRNKLLRLAQGNYIYNLDVDDLLVENRLSYILKLIRSTDIDVVGFASKKTLETKTCSLKIKPNNKEVTYFKSGEEFILSHSNHRVEVWWYIVKRKFLEENEICFEDNQNNADVLFTYEILLNCKKMVYFDSICHYYYQSPNSIMRSNDSNERMKLITSMYEMSLSLGKLVNELDKKKNKSRVVDIIRLRLSQSIFSNLMKMIRRGVSFNLINEKLTRLNSIGAYPIDLTSHRRPYLKYKLLTMLVNNLVAIRLGIILVRLRKAFNRK